MSARTDYPWPVDDRQQAIKQWGVMCDEIDTLRATPPHPNHAPVLLVPPGGALVRTDAGWLLVKPGES